MKNQKDGKTCNEFAGSKKTGTENDGKAKGDIVSENMMKPGPINQVTARGV